LLSLEHDGWADRLKLRWANVEGNTAVEFKIYQFRDGLPFERQYMTDLATVSAGGVSPFAISIVHLSGWVTMTGVDAEGHESAPAEPMYVGWRYYGKLDVNGRGDVFVVDRSVQRIDGRDVVHPVPLRAARGYWPATAVAAGRNNDLFVLSRDNAGVCVFGPDGRQKALFGTKGAADGQLDQPSDIDLDADGNVYIADTNNNRIAVFGADGAFITNAGAAQLEKPVAVEVDGGGNLYIIQSQKPGVIKIPKTAAGYGEPEAFAETQGQPFDVTSDASGRIYIAQNAEPALLVIGADGNGITTLAAWKGQNLKGVAGLAYDRRGVLVGSIRNWGVIVRMPVNQLVPAPE
jgi:DNA-binding beta-propeller fold protein YncE